VVVIGALLYWRHRRKLRRELAEGERLLEGVHHHENTAGSP